MDTGATHCVFGSSHLAVEQPYATLDHIPNLVSERGPASGKSQLGKGATQQMMEKSESKEMSPMLILGLLVVFVSNHSAGAQPINARPPRSTLTVHWR
jgi:hypothetical protein